MDIVVTTAPASGSALAICPLADVKSHMKLVTDKRNTELTAKIEAVYSFLAEPARNALNRTVAQAQFRLYLPAFPADAVWRLPFPPLKSVESIQYLNTAGVETTLSSDDYIVRSGDAQYVGEIERVGTTWPTAKTHPRAVWADFTAGYETVPDELVLLIKLMVAHYDANTEATINEPRQMAVNRKVEFGYDYLVSMLRVPSSVVEGEYA